MWSSQDVKMTKIAICRVFPTALTRTRVTGQRAVRMECLRAQLVCLFQVVAAAAKKVGFCYQTAAWEPAEVMRTVWYFYVFFLFSPVKSGRTN